MTNDETFSKLKGNIEPVQELLAKIQTHGFQVEFFPDMASPYSGNGLVTAAADWHHHEKIWRVYFPATGRAHQVYHELLHVQLGCINRFPMMVPVGNQNANNIQELNNDFDHVHVIPGELKAFPEASKYWECEFDRKYREIAFAAVDHLGVLNRKLSLIRGWLVLPECLHGSEVATRYREALRRENWLESADAMVKAVQRAGLNKSDAVEAFREGLGLDFPSDQSIKFSAI